MDPALADLIPQFLVIPLLDDPPALHEVKLAVKAGFVQILEKYGKSWNLI